MVKTTLLLLIFTANLLHVHAQVMITVVDEETMLPIEGVQLYIENTEHQTQFAVTDVNGKVQTKLNPPIKVRLTHLSYKSQLQSVDQKSITFRLKPVTILLKEMVVTGQYSPQSAAKSVYKVRTIDHQRIESQGANTLQDVLANELNIRFGRDNALGTSGMSIQGVSGQNIKVLIDGVPMVGRSGVANEIDLNQININTVERIELVEGPMAVNFGADALAGLINIITKKGGIERLTANITVQEETVESNYSLFDEGVHNASLSVGSNITDRIFVQAEGRVNSFGGWIGDQTSYTDRDRQWYPKIQHFANGLFRYSVNDFSVHYRLDYLNENIENLGKINDLKPNVEPSSSDQDFFTERWMHQLQAEWKANNWLLNAVLSYNDYDRLTEGYTTFLTSDLETNRREIQDTYYKTLFFRSTGSTNRLNWGSLQMGVDASFDQGGGSTLSEGAKTSKDIAFFVSSEIKISNKLAIRPGIRYGYNSLYSTEPSPSLNFKYDIKKNTQLRVGYGRGFRVPSLRELYHEFIDTNHNIVGNPDLSPEYSHNISGDLTRSFDKLNLNTSVSVFYNYIKDQITFFTPQESNAATSYLNLEEFRSTGSSLTINWQHGAWKIGSGAAYIGRYQRLTDQADVPGFVFNWEANTNLSYKFSPTNTTFSTFYKFNGALRDYRLVDANNDGELAPELQGIDAFHLMDFTVNQTIKKSVSVTLGARNIFNVTAVDNNISSGGAHSGGTGSTAVGYGTSFFIRVNYLFKTNN
jgi:outer membrane receptor for ferrienterochelin and colicins